MPSPSCLVAAAGSCSVGWSGLEPWRRPDWRYQQVLANLDRYPRPRRRWAGADQYLRAMRDFLFWLRTGRMSVESRLAAPFPGPSAVWGLYRSRHPLSRLAVECLILARQSDAEIARRQQLSVTAVRWYGEIFFDVRNWLGAPDWIVAKVLHGTGLRGQADPQVTIRQLAYFGGPAVAEHVLNALLVVAEDKAPLDTESSVAGMAVSDAALRAAIAGNASELNQKNLLRLLKSARKIWAKTTPADSFPDEESTASDDSAPAAIESQSEHARQATPAESPPSPQIPGKSLPPAERPIAPPPGAPPSGRVA